MPEILVLQISFSFSCIRRNKNFSWKSLWSFLRLKSALSITENQSIFTSNQSQMHLSFQKSQENKDQRVAGAERRRARNTESKETVWHLWAATLCLQTSPAYPETMSRSWNQVKFQAFILHFDKFFLPSKRPGLCLGIQLSFHSWGATFSVVSMEKLSTWSVKLNIYSI